MTFVNDANVNIANVNCANVNCAIALGSNLGDSRAILDASLQQLEQREGISLKAISRWYQTEPVGPPQPDYLNGCALLMTSLAPEKLLQTLLDIEQQFGRVRQEKNGARTLDLDLIFYGDYLCDSLDLQIPHPRFAQRAFVLVPLAEIAPDWIDPRSQQTIAELVKAIDCSGVRLYEPP
jgi:2-amino-4-hydroxy-6-hydroxymethyldihydropteridine diphosphokinase